MMPTSKLTPSSPDSIEPWRLRAFDAPDPALLKEAEEPPEEKVVLPTAEEIEAMQEMARKEAYQEGYHEGYREGFSDGENERKILSQISENFQNELSRLDESVAAELSAYALVIARRLIGFAYQFDDQLVTRLVDQAIQALPANLEPTRVLLHPEDLGVVEKHLTETFSGRKLSFVAEPSISRGGLKLMTPTTDIDGTFETRWQRVTSSLDAPSWQDLPSRLQTEAVAIQDPAPSEETVSSSLHTPLDSEEAIQEIELSETEEVADQ